MGILEEVVLDQASLPPRDQGARPTCIAFALSELNLQHATHVGELSPEYLYQEAASHVPDWKSGDGVPLRLAIQAASSLQPVEADYPYQIEEPGAPVTPPPRHLMLYGSRIELFLHDTNSLISAMRDGRPVGIGLQLTRSFYFPVEGVVSNEDDIIEGALHAVALVGLGWAYKEPYFLIRNSWGSEWGIEGTAWIANSYLRTHALCAFGG